MTPVEPVRGYMMWKDGKPYGLPGGWDETKRALLIGYDFIPLRGLEVTEQEMATQGIVVCETQVEIAPDGEHDCYGAIVNGRFVPHMIGWSVCQETREESLESTAFYFGKGKGGLQPVKSITSMKDEEAYACHEYFWRSLNMRVHPDRRRVSTLAKARLRVVEIFERQAIEIVPIRYRFIGS